MDSDEKFTPRLLCDIKLELSGPNETTLNKWSANALRSLADRLEQDEFVDGFTDVKDSIGKKIGTIYIDYSQTNF